MSACTFFGHRDCPDEIKPKLREVLIDLIENEGVEMFYVGRQGQFDAIVRSTLRQLTEAYPQIRYAVVLERVPGKQEGADYSDTMLPEGVEKVHPHYAISWRNKWMIDHADYAVTYIIRSWGGAVQSLKRAKARERRGEMTIINLGDV